MPDRCATARRRFGARVIWFLAAAMMVTGSAAAADVRQPEADETRRHGAGLRLDHDRLAPRVSLAMESFSVFRDANPASELHDHVMFDQLSETVRRGAKSVTRRAVRNHLLEAIHLDRGIERLRAGVGGPSNGDVSFSFGVHSALPQLGVRYRIGRSTVRFRIGAEGDMGLHFRNSHLGRGDVSAGYDGRDTVTLRGRLVF